MPKQTKYISIIREPYSQLKSTFNYFNLAGKMKEKNISKLEVSHNFGLFLSNPDFYSRQLKLKYMPNFIAFDLGFPLSDRADMAKIFRFIREIENDFSLVMIMEYFDESLVMLKRTFCWPMRSILYISKNVRKYDKGVGKPNTTDPIDKRHKGLYRKWSQIDYVLYDHFNETLWKRVAREKRFNEELEYFRDLKRNVSLHCLAWPTLRYQVMTSEWSDSFTVTPKTCDRMKLSVLNYIKRLKETYHALPNTTLSPDNHTEPPEAISKILSHRI